MNLLRKLMLLVMAAVFIGAGLWTIFSYSWQAEYFYSPGNKSLFSKNGPTEEFSIHSKDYPKGNNPHYIPNLKPIIEGNLCLWIEAEDDKFHSINKKSSKTKSPLCN